MQIECAFNMHSVLNADVPLESMEDTLRRQEKNRTRMASMKGFETQE